MWCRTYCYHLYELFLLLEYPHPLILLLGCFLSIRIHLKCAISKWENFSIADKANKNETFPLQRILIIVTFLVSCSCSKIHVFTNFVSFSLFLTFDFSLLHFGLRPSKPKNQPLHFQLIPSILISCAHLNFLISILFLFPFDFILLELLSIFSTLFSRFLSSTAHWRFN